MVQIVSKIQSTFSSSMSIKDCIVSHTSLLINDDILDNLVRIFHVGSLANIAHNACIKSLRQELKRPYSESTSWPQTVTLVVK